MNIALEESQEDFVKQVVSAGRFASESEVVSVAIRLVQAREQKLDELRAMIVQSLAEGGAFTAEDLDRDMEEQDAELIALGYSE